MADFVSNMTAWDISEISGHGAGGQVSQRDSTIKSQDSTHPDMTLHFARMFKRPCNPLYTDEYIFTYIIFKAV